MKKIALLFVSFFTNAFFAQNEQLAQNYFDRGEFEKALISYEELLKMQPGNGFIFKKQLNVINSYNNMILPKKHSRTIGLNTNKAIF
jgi:tetratricopeptide (TPR) repeat protein